MDKSNNLIDLYSEKILELACNISLYERLKFPDITIKKRAPICGSMIAVDLKITEEKVTAYAQDVKACALGQASASILAKDIIGKTSEEIVATRNAVKQMLCGEPYILNIFTDYTFLSPAADYKHRHPSIMLALDATIEGISEIKEPIHSRSKIY